MAIILNDNVQPNLGKPLDNKYLEPTLNRPYIDVAEVNTTIIEALRHTGLTVNIGGVEYWYASGTTDGDLVEKTPSVAAGGGITAAANGLSKSGNTVVLGGSLTGDTLITKGTNDLTIEGDGFISLGATGFEANIPIGGTKGVVLGGEVLSDSAGSDSYISVSDTELKLESLGGSLTFNGSDLIFNDYRVGADRNGIEYNADYSANYTDRSLVDAGYVTGLTDGINADISAVSAATVNNANDITFISGETAANDADIAFISANTINTASNGLTKSGVDVKLGGDLTENTTINGVGNSLSINNLSDGVISVSGASSLLELNGKTNGQLVIKSQSGTLAGDDFTDSVGFNLDFNGGAFTVIDNRSTASGLEYLDDYSTNYNDRSLVDKAYVDAVATGLDVKDSVLLATTANINLSSFTGTIDGVTVSDGDRVLVKDQTTASENGIYVYSGASSSFVRSDDFDGTPTGEVTQGAFAFVVSGDSNSGNGYVVTTPDPITIDTTAINWSLFSNPLDIADGTGTTVTVNGSNRSISVELAPDSGLDFDATSAAGRLRIDPNIDGQGITFTSGVLDLNITDASVVGTAIDVKSDTGGADTLFIDTDDLPVNGANNGLSIESGNVVLGGTLTGDTTINSTGSFTLTFEGQDVEYAADYSASFTDRSLTDAGYVTGLTSALEDDIAFISGQTAVAADNGLSLQSGTVVLGGALTGDTLVDLNNHGLKFGTGAVSTGANSFAVGEGSSATGDDSIVLGRNASTNVADGLAIGQNSSMEASNGLAIGNGSNVTSDADDSVAIGNNSYVSQSFGVGVGTGSYVSAESAIAIGNATESSGSDAIAIGRSACASEIFSLAIGSEACSLYSSGVALGVSTYACGNSAVTVGVSSNAAGTCAVAIGANACVYNANNSIAMGSSAYVCQSSTSAISIGTSSTSSGNTAIAINGCAFGYNAIAIKGTVGSGVTPASEAISIGGNNSSCSQAAISIGSCATINGTNAIDSIAIGRGTCIDGTSASDALAIGSCASASDVGSIAIGHLAQANSPGPNSIAIGRSNSVTSENSAIIGGTGNTIQTGNDGVVLIGGTGVTITTGSYTNTVVVPNLALLNEPENGSATDAVLVWDSTDNLVKQVSGSSLGEDNNTYAITSVTTTTLTPDEYVVIVDTSASSQTVTLPSSPADGQAYKIKDNGNALTNIITIDGNGNNIDGSTSASINTNYGALELVYSSTSGEWLTLAFIV